MNRRLRHLPAFLFLIVPLGVLGWFGSVEFGRLEEQAARALRDHALKSLSDASRQFERTVDRACFGPLEMLDSLEDRALVAAVRDLADGTPPVLDLVLLGADGEMLFPVASPDFSEALVFSEPAQHPSINRAEVLEELGDFEGARLLLEAAAHELDREDDDPPVRADRVRAHFALGGVLRRLGRMQDAETEYAIASLAMRPPRRAGPVAPEGPADATILYLCEVALAELAFERDGDARPIVETMFAVAHGRHDGVPDALLVATLDMFAERLGRDSPLHAEVEAALELDRLRREGREFAAEYGTFLSETVRRRIRQLGGQSRLVQVCSTSAGDSLLVLRRARQEETDRLRDGRTAWVGLRFELDAVLRLAFQDSVETDFTMLVTNPDGARVWPHIAAPIDGSVDASQTTIGGLRMHAIPVDAPRALEARRASFRNRAVLIMLLVATAGAGAFLLIRSASRETEVAALKVDLVSRVTHELKTPLALIRMYAETLTLGRARDAEQAARFSGIISREADHLTRMIDRVLDFSRQEAGTLRYEPRSCDVAELLEALAEAYRPQVEARGCHLETDLEPDVHAEVDPTAFESAVVNLLENAVKYTAGANDGSGEIRIELVAHSEQAVIAVQDRGIGIPEGEHDAVFSSFYRASNAGEVRGAGLGLSLVRHFAEAHGGRAWASRREGGGTTVTIALPAESRTRSRPRSPTDPCRSPASS